MAACAVWLHGTAADRCARRRSMTAMLPTDIFADLGEILAEMEL
jgi:NAD(P)H-hydrate epimerase